MLSAYRVRFPESGHPEAGHVRPYREWLSVELDCQTRSVTLKRRWKNWRVWYAT